MIHKGLVIMDCEDVQTKREQVVFIPYQPADPDNDWLRRNVPFAKMTDDAVAKGWALHDKELQETLGFNQVKRWGLRFVDVVSVTAQGNLPIIKAVNGEEDPEVCRKRPHFMLHLVEGLGLRHGTSKLPLDRSKLQSMKLMDIVAPFPRGGKLGITGPAGCGKTWFTRDFTKILLEFADLDYLIAADVGEKVPDVGTRADILAAYNGPVIIEHYHGFRQWTAVNSAIVGCERGHRLSEMNLHTAITLDSLMGLVRQLGKGVNNGAYASKGVSGPALDKAVDFLYAGEIVGGGSLTVIITCLDEGPNSRSRVVLDEAGWQTFTVVLALGKGKPWEPRPHLDLRWVQSREQECFLSPTRLQLQEELKNRIWAGRWGKYDKALAYILKLAGVPGTVEEAAETWREWWEKDDERRRMSRLEAARQDLTDIAAKLKRLGDENPEGAAMRVASVTGADWSKLAEAVAKMLPKPEPEPELEEPEVDPHPELPPPAEYVALSKRLKEEGATDKSFGRITATRIRNEVGLSLEELEEALRSGKRPSDLY